MNIRISLIIPLLLLTLGANAAEQETDSEEKLDWYDVEVIVFRHHDYQALSQEQWPRNPGSPEIRSARELLPPLPEHLSAAHSKKLKEALAYIQLRDETHLMQDKFEQLREAGDYEPLLHLSWRQPGLGPDEAEAVHIHGGVNWSLQANDGTLAVDANTAEPLTESASDRVPSLATVMDSGVEGPPAPYIDGTIKLIRKRFLHVEADLLYRAPYVDRKDNQLQAQQWPQAFRLQESRRMRSREIHYLDHPMFGVLILATPYEAPPVEEDAAKPVAAPVAATPAKRVEQLQPKARQNNPLQGTIRR